MLKSNALIINGVSTGDLPFYCAVTRTPEPYVPKRKDKIYDLPFVHGALKQKIDAYEPLELEAELYIHEATPRQLREFKSVLASEGTLTTHLEPDLHYNYYALGVNFEQLDRVGGYDVSLKFYCEPFAYEEEQTKRYYNNDTIVNHTNAPMYPLITVEGNSSSARLKIGEQEMVFHDGIQGRYFIECKHGFQDVYDIVDKKYNHTISGDFFEIPQGESKISFTGIRLLRIRERWGWL